MFADNFKIFIGILSIPVALEEDKLRNDVLNLCVKFKISGWFPYKRTEMSIS